MTTSLDHFIALAGRASLSLESGRGSYVFDSGGRRYLDAITGIGVNALGYGHPRLTAALVEQAHLCVHTSNLFHHPFQDQLAGRLCAMTGLDQVFFSSTGTEAVETALKAVGRPARGNWSRCQIRFHGRTMGSLAVTGRPLYRRPFEPFVPRVDFVEPNDFDALERAVTGDTAGIILEPILGEGGIIPLDPAFLVKARDLATRCGALLMVDESRWDLGRTGRHFEYQNSGIRPDIVVLAKPLAGGLPLGATLFTENKAADALPPGTHGTTFGGGPLACRVALEFLDVMEELLPNVRCVGEQLLQDLRALSGRYPVIREVRGKGLMIGIQLGLPGQPLVDSAREHGLLINCTHATVLRLLPPFTLTGEEAQQIVTTLQAVIGSVKPVLAG